MSIAAVDLFCGVGGLTHGLTQAGIKVFAGYDIDEHFKMPYEVNNGGAKYINKSVSTLSSQEITEYFSEKYSLLAGCAPCQPFSALNNGKKVAGDDWSLLASFGKLVKESSPTFVTMENVPQLQKHDVYKEFLALLENSGYFIDARIVYCPDYGIPQKRKRLVLVASMLAPITLIPPTHSSTSYVTVKDVIGNLPPLAAGETDKDDPLHCVSATSPLNIKRLQHSRPNGTWEDWPEELIAECHKRLAQKNYQTAYGRMAWDEPSPTITTQFHGISHGRFGHPEQDRPISLREGAILQTFPENYMFTPKGRVINKTIISKMIGNAVPVRLGKIIGETFFKQVFRDTSEGNWQ